MVGFLLKYFPGSVFDNTYSSTCSELFAYLSAALIFSKLGLKPTFMIGYGIALIGALLIIFIGDANT